MSCIVTGIQSSSFCWKDYLKIDGKKYCGKNTPQSQMTQSSFKVEFRTDRRVRSGGFRCAVQLTGKIFLIKYILLFFINSSHIWDRSGPGLES